MDPNILSIRKLKTITFSFLYVLVKSFNTLVRVRSLKSLSNVSPKPTPVFLSDKDKDLETQMLKTLMELEIQNDSFGDTPKRHEISEMIVKIRKLVR